MNDLFAVPVYQMDREAGRVHPTARNLLPNAESADRLDGITVLVVDDEPDTRDLLKAGLENCGAQVIVAAPQRMRSKPSRSEFRMF